MKRWALPAAVAVLFGFSAVAVADAPSFHVVNPVAADPLHTFLVHAQWLSGLGCPTGTAGAPTDPACPTGDPADTHVEGLLLVKTGPTSTGAAAVAELADVGSLPVAELGFDIRRAGGSADLRGSQCGPVSPRFEITLGDGSGYSLACASPPPSVAAIGSGWTRLRWRAPLLAWSVTTRQLVDISGRTVSSLRIVLDGGQDANGGADGSGLAVLDNVDVNGVLVGRG